VPRTIPFTDLGAAAREVWPVIEDEFVQALLAGRYVAGPAVEAFEERWARYCDTAHAVGTANGTDALTLTLEALGVGAGDEVVVPSNTFVATAAAVVRAGATPRFADVAADTLLLTPQTLQAASTPRTRAVVAVHLFGQMPDMDALGAAADRAGILLVEDAAQAHGARWRGRQAGSFGVAGCFSFYPGKNLGAFGDAGAVVTSDAALADRVRSLANHGRTRGRDHYAHDLVGTNSRLDSLQAIVLSAKLARSEDWIRARAALAAGYEQALRDTPVRLVAADPGARHAHHLLVVRVAAREVVRARLAEAGIETGIHYPVPCHRQPALRRFAREPLPVCEAAAQEILSLPMHPHLPPEDVRRVCRALLDAVDAVDAAAQAPQAPPPSALHATSPRP
jgi:dTDP-4-amino-4,6-dideoxygalactose transaminase